MLRELPGALPEGPGRARERSKSSPGAPKNALRALRASEEHSESLKLLQERSGIAAMFENFDSSLHFFGASCQLATFLRRALLSYIRYTTLATPRSRHHAGYAKLGSLRHVGCATFATLRSPCCVRYATFATLRSLRYAGYITFTTLLSLRYVC